MVDLHTGNLKGILTHHQRIHHKVVVLEGVEGGCGHYAVLAALGKLEAAE